MYLSSPNGLTPLTIDESLTLNNSLKLARYFLDIAKWSAIYRHSHNTIFTSLPCTVIHKLFYVFALEHLLETWNYGNMIKNLTRHLICYLIGLISTNFTLRAFKICCIMSIIYNIIIITSINGLIFHSYIFHNEKQFIVCAR